METNIRLFKTYISPEAKANVQRVLDSGWCGLGPETEKFENEFASYLGAKYAVATNSGTEALRLAVHIASRKTTKGYAITTPNTFIASNSVLFQNDLVPVFADIERSTGMLDLNSVYHAFKTYDCGVLMLVHYGGYPANVCDFADLAKRYRVDIIHDCAHAVGAIYRGERLGKDLKYACYSFHAVKPMPIGEGGMLVTNSEEVAEKARQLRWFGIDKSTYERTNKGYSWNYDIKDFGYKGHMWDVQAAIGRGQLPHLDAWTTYRTKLVDRYRKNLLTCDFPIAIKRAHLLDKSSHHLFVIRFKDKEQRGRAIGALDREGIQYSFHYKANYRYTNYSTFPIIKNEEMTAFEDTALTLPLHLELTTKDVDLICDVIMEVI